MGYNHVASGLGVGLVTLPAAPASTLAGQAAWVVGCGGASLLPDLDAPGSAAGRMWGPVTETLARGVAILGRGHRGATHDVLLAPVLFAGITLAACSNTVGTAVVVGLMVGLSLQGLVLSGARRVGVLGNLAVSAAAAGWLSRHADLPASSFALVVALGVFTHIAGDALTTEGVPVPLLWMTGSRRRLGLRLFPVGGRFERVLIAPLLSLTVLALLGGHLEALYGS